MTDVAGADAADTQRVLVELLDGDETRGISTVFEILAGEPRIKPSRGLLIDPGDAALQRWTQRVVAAAALVASPAVLRVYDELLDELAESPALAADVFARCEPCPALSTDRRTALLALPRN